MKKRELFWGFLFIVAAALIILNQFGLFAGISVYTLVATFFLVVIMVKSATHINFWGILLPMALICILYAKQWHITDFTPWPALLTAVLISTGLSLIFRRPYHWHHFDHNHFDHHHSFSKNVINEKDDNVVNCNISFGESIKYVNSDRFEKADISCSFGELKVYFDNALIPSGKADIYVNVSFGEAVLYIPKTWKVISDVHVFLGDFDNNNRYSGSDVPEVKIQGNVSFGDVKIIYV